MCTPSAHLKWAVGFFFAASGESSCLVTRPAAAAVVNKTHPVSREHKDEGRKSEQMRG